METRQQAQAPSQSRNQVKRFIVALQRPQVDGQTEPRPQLGFALRDTYHAKEILEWVWLIAGDHDEKDIASFLGAHAAPGWRILVAKFDDWACWPVHDCEDTQTP